MTSKKELNRIIRELKLSGGKSIPSSFKRGKYRYARTTEGYKRFLITKDNFGRLKAKRIGGKISQKAFVSAWVNS